MNIHFKHTNNSPNMSPDAIAFRDNAAYLAKLAVMCIGIYILFHFIFGLSVVSGSSMYPTFHDKDFVIFQRAGYDTPEYGDVIEFTSIDPTTGKDQILIKRVIGLPGDVIEVRAEEQKVYRNGIALEEDYTNPGYFTVLDLDGPVTIEEGCVFVLGDNRPNSRDSRSDLVGQVPYSDILGKCILQIPNRSK